MNRRTGNTQVYSLTANFVVPRELQSANSQTKRRKIRTARSQINLINDFEFPGGNRRVRVTADGLYIGACGNYPPQMKVYDVIDMTQKFGRHMDYEAVDFQFLSTTFRKMAFLQCDRFVELHNDSGIYHRFRTPNLCHVMVYKPEYARLVMAGTGSNIHRVDLETGAFLKPLESTCDQIAALKLSERHPGIIFAGGSQGVVEIWDSRMSISKPTSTLPISKAEDMVDHELGNDITCMDIDSRGICLVAGDSQGVCRVLDIRSPNILAEKDHECDEAIVDILFGHRTSPSAWNQHQTIVSADKRFVKAWTTEKASDKTETIASFQAESLINSLCIYPGSGIIFVAQDACQIGVHFLPALGLAPSWAMFLDSAIEDLAADREAQSVYDTFEFITAAELKNLGEDPDRLECKPHMHGFLVPKRKMRNLRLKAGSASATTVYEQRVVDIIKSKEAPMRISVPKKQPNFNPKLVKHLQRVKELDAKLDRVKAAEAVLEDSRFKPLFNNPAFAADQNI